MNETARKAIWWVAMSLAVCLAIAAAWNGAVISVKSGVSGGAPPSVGEWSVLAGTVGGSALSAIVSVLTWAAQYWTGKGQSFVVKWLPVLQTLLDVEAGKSVDEITVRFEDGTSRTLKIGQTTPQPVTP